MDCARGFLDGYLLRGDAGDSRFFGGGVVDFVVVLKENSGREEVKSQVVVCSAVECGLTPNVIVEKIRTLGFDAVVENAEESQESVVAVFIDAENSESLDSQINVARQKYGTTPPIIVAHTPEPTTTISDETLENSLYVLKKPIKLGSLRRALNRAVEIGTTRRLCDVASGTTPELFSSEHDHLLSPTFIAFKDGLTDAARESNYVAVRGKDTLEVENGALFAAQRLRVSENGKKSVFVVDARDEIERVGTLLFGRGSRPGLLDLDCVVVVKNYERLSKGIVRRINSKLERNDVVARFVVAVNDLGAVPVCDLSRFRTIQSPPYNRQIKDVPLFVASVVREYADSTATTKKFVPYTVCTKIVQERWFSSFSSLKNALEKAIEQNNATVLTENDVFVAKPKITHDLEDVSFANVPIEELERKALVDTLVETNGNKAAAARRLGVSEKTVYNKLNLWKIETPTENDCGNY